MKNKKLSLALTISFAAVGMLLTVVGFLLGDSAEILSKGVNICLECIGIG